MFSFPPIVAILLSVILGVIVGSRVSTPLEAGYFAGEVIIWWALGFCAAWIITMGHEFAGKRKRKERIIFSSILATIGPPLFIIAIGFSFIFLGELLESYAHNKEYRKRNNDERPYNFLIFLKESR